MKTKTTLREAVVLLCAALMLIPASVALANTNTHDLSIPQAPKKADSMIWDNTLGYHGALGGIIVATGRPDGWAEPVDDFQLVQAADITHVVWQGGYFQTQLAQGDIDYNWDWNFVFWNSSADDSHPVVQLYNMTVANASISRELWYIYIRPDTQNHYWVGNYSCDLPQAFHAEANTHYWVTIRGVGAYPPQACWVRHNESYGGIKLNEAMFRGVLWGKPDWVQLHTMAPDGLVHDLNFQFFGPTADDTPPVTTCTLTGNMSGTNYVSPVKVTLTAVDTGSGVASTHYKLDGGSDTTYASAFDVTAAGDHILVFWSIDNAGNIETAKTQNFTVVNALNIVIKKGLGITVELTNSLATDITSVPWSISCTGGLILFGATGSGTIPTIAAGATKKVHAFPVGIGSITITATAGSSTASATGFLFLFLVV